MLNLLAIWRAHRLFPILREAWGRGRPDRGAERRRDVLVRAGGHARRAEPARGWPTASGSCPGASASTTGATRIAATPISTPSAAASPAARGSTTAPASCSRERAPVEAFAARRGARVDARRANGRRGRGGRVRADPAALPARAVADDPALRELREIRRAARVRRDACASTLVCVALPLKPPVKPQLALSRKALPEGEELGVRAEVGRLPRARLRRRRRGVPADPRNGRPLRRYFPELEFPAGEYVLDGELVILGERRPRGVRRCSRTGCTRPSRGCRCWRSGHPPSSAPSTCSRWAASSAEVAALASAARRSRSSSRSWKRTPGRSR